MKIELSTDAIKNRMLRYLDLALPVKGSMGEEVAKKFDAFQRGKNEYAGRGLDFVKEPYIELATVYKESQETLADLVETKDIEPEVAEAFAKYISDDSDAKPKDIRLYTHQLDSLRSVNKGRNLVVCTGTGSGKTECFLLPVVNAIWKQHKNAKESGTEYKPYVRALILYPMNALVNDQIRRLRKLLQYLPGITFGRYTSETQKKQQRFNGENDDFPNVWKVGLDKGYMAVQDNAVQKVRDEDFLPEEYNNRARWQDGGADILVTNFAMLERLLLLPNQKLFGNPWDFIVLDEAHSYSGASGTEIAWLIRRLTNRIDPDGSHDVRFLATSATLSTAENKETRDRHTKAFAARLFPATVETFDVHSGEIEPPALLQNKNKDTNLFGENEEVAKLYGDTVSFEAKKTNHKIAGKQIKLLENIIENNGKVCLAQLIELDASIFERHPSVIINNQPVESQEIIVTDEVRWLCKLMLTFSRNHEPYRSVLHDELDRSRSDENNDLIGNRLRLLDVWKNLARDDVEHPRYIHWETVTYLYRAIELLLQPEVRIENSDNELPEGSVQDVRVVLCASICEKFKGIIKDYLEKKNQLAKEEEDLFNRWRIIFFESKGDNYREWIYNAIASRKDVADFFEKASTPNVVSKVAGEIGLDAASMGRLIDIGALAYQKGKRRPFVDVRFHQVVRDITNVGVYFKGGNPQCPVFVHSEDEFAESGERIFGLGVCRRCGQPYLLGYGQSRLEGDGVDFNELLSRFPIGKYTHLHALALTAPKDVDEDADAQTQGVCVNLKTGKLSCNANVSREDGDVAVYWLIPHRNRNENGDESFLSKCSACGGSAVAAAQYGIITPYEASGTQYKIKMLEAFAREANPDPDDTVRNTSPAGGRKILSFADSRSGAASLAFSFDKTMQTEYCDDLVCILRRDFNNEAMPLPAIQNAIQNLRANGFPEEAIQQAFPPPPLRVPCVNDLIRTPAGENLFREIVREDHYEGLLNLERKDGSMESEENVAKLRVLKTLLAGSRRIGLLPKKILVVKSRTVEGLTRGDDNFNHLFDAPFEGVSEADMKSILQEVYSYLVCTKRIRFENDDLKNAFYRWEPNDNFTRATVAPQQWNENHPVLGIVMRHLENSGMNNLTHNQVLNLLNGIWTIFERLVTPTGNTYVFDFAQICDDLIVERGKNFTDEKRVLPFIIQEHTAQVDSKIGAVYQQAFSEGKINILSCSTTFEMGVDVGSLNNVFLGNMPPTAANYRQRAGRAGRRPGAAPWILTLCGSMSSYDRDRYEDPKKLFFGEIEPPHLYLNRPQFAARHFRAEALHDFFEWIYEKKRNSNAQDERLVARKWNKISYFLFGANAVKVNESFRANAIPTTCCSWIEDWKQENKKKIDLFVSKIHGYEADFIANLPDAQGYSPVDDVIFQLTGADGFCGKTGEAGILYFRSLGGCNVPELNVDGSLRPNSILKWRSLNDRLKWKLHVMANDRGGVIPDEINWEVNANLSLSQAKLLWKSTIDILSDACVLPRYGFPVDTIELVRNSEDGYAYGIELLRPVHLGMYEYAPDQSVYANKRRYQSGDAKVYRFNNGDANALGNAQGTLLRYCNTCHKVFFHRETQCPCCNNETRDQSFVTPEVFIAQKSSINPPRQHSPRGQRIVSWSGSISEKTLCAVEGMSLVTAEPTERAVHYVNSKVPRKTWYYLCEVPTNVALWIPGFWNSAFEGWELDRTYNAFTSAMFALRKAMSDILNVNERDIGGVVQAYCPEGGHDRNFWFVFYDADNGGGSGCVLDLILRGSEDKDGKQRIREIVELAKKRLSQCTCGCGLGLDSTLPPIPTFEYHNECDKRPAASCYHCLRTYDNQFEHDKLDRYDALVVLNLLLGGEKNSPETVLQTLGGVGVAQKDSSQGGVCKQDQRRWIPFEGKLRVNQWYKKTDGNEFQYKSNMNINRGDVQFEKE